MKTDQGTPGTNKDRSYRSLQQTLEFIAKAGETVTAEYSDTKANDKDEGAKDHWDRSHKLATLTAQRSGGWLQTLALFVSAIGCACAGYAAVVSTIQAKTALEALKQATISAQASTKSSEVASESLAINKKYIGFNYRPSLSVNTNNTIFINKNFYDIANYIQNQTSYPIYIYKIISYMNPRDEKITHTAQNIKNFYDEKTKINVLEPKETQKYNGQIPEIKDLLSYPDGNMAYITSEFYVVGLDGNRYIRSVCFVFKKSGDKFVSNGQFCHNNNDDASPVSSF